MEVCKNLSANLELEPLLHSLIEAASELTASETSSILVYDKENRFLRFAAAPWFQMDKLRTIGVPLDKSVAGWVFSNKKPMALHHADKDDRIFRVVDRELSDDTKSLLAVPMLFKGEPIGVIESMNKGNDAHYTEEDVLFLETLASQAAVVIQLRQLLDEAKKAYEKAVELDRMKTDFIAIASHELRTPLGLIIGHSTLLEESATPQQMEQIKVVQTSAMRLKEIIEEFGDESNIKRGLSSMRNRKVGVALLVRQVLDTFRDLADSKNIQLSDEVPEQGLSFEGDADKIGMALQNLVKNALIFTNEGGKVKVKGEEVPGYIKISVMDNGIGIPPEEQEKIFQRFYQVEKHLTRKHGGMGLGLAIAKEMVEMHGGRITVESIEGKGSKFMFFLPANIAQASAAQKVFLS